MGLVADRPFTPEEFLDECIEFKRRNQRGGRFMQELMLGKLSRSQIIAWAKDFYFYVEPAIPSIAAWLANAPTLPSRDAYKLIARNLAGEMGFVREAEHHDLYLQFCAGLDLFRDEILEQLPLPGTIGAASTVGYYCRSSFLEGLGAFGLAVEMEVPGLPNGAEIFHRALREHYDVDERSLEFWAVHIEAEEEHGANAVRAIELCGQTREQQALIRRAFRFSVLAHRGMREGYDRFLEPDL